MKKSSVAWCEEREEEGEGEGEGGGGGGMNSLLKKRIMILSECI
jgi:hypothetical protein